MRASHRKCKLKPVDDAILGLTNCHAEPAVKNQQISKRDVFTLAGVYLGLLLLVIALPENNPALSGIALGVCGLASFLTIEHIS